MKAKLLEVKEEMQPAHAADPEQGEWLKQVVSGFFNYHAVPTSSRAPSPQQSPRHGSLATRAAAA